MWEDELKKDIALCFPFTQEQVDKLSEWLNPKIESLLKQQMEMIEKLAILALQSNAYTDYQDLREAVDEAIAYLKPEPTGEKK